MNDKWQGREALIEKIQELPDEQAAVVEDFVDFLREREDDCLLVRSTYPISERTLSRIWDNPADAEYDRL